MAKERSPFNSGEEFFAAKSFKFHSKNYAVGDVFPWRRLSCSLRKIRTLHDGKFVDCGERGYADKAKEEAAAKSSARVEDTPDEPPADDDTDGEDALSPLTYDPAIHEIDNETRGEWWLTQDNERIARLRPVVAKKLRKLNKMVELEEDDYHEDNSDEEDD